MGFLELRQEPGVYSRVTAGMSIRNSSLFIEVPPTLRGEEPPSGSLASSQSQSEIVNLAA